MSDSFDETPVDMAIRFQNGLIASATGSAFDGGDDAYKELRHYFASRADRKAKLPHFVRRCCDLGQFWGFIKYERARYAERRDLIWDAFRPLNHEILPGDSFDGVIKTSRLGRSESSARSHGRRRQYCSSPDTLAS